MTLNTALKRRVAAAAKMPHYTKSGPGRMSRQGGSRRAKPPFKSCSSRRSTGPGSYAEHDRKVTEHLNMLALAALHQELGLYA